MDPAAIWEPMVGLMGRGKPYLLFLPFLFGCIHPEGTWQGKCGESVELSLDLPGHTEEFPCDQDSDSVPNEQTCSRRNPDLPVTGTLWWSGNPQDLLDFTCDPWKKRFGKLTVENCSGNWQTTFEPESMGLLLKVKFSRENGITHMQGFCTWHELTSTAQLIRISE